MSLDWVTVILLAGCRLVLGSTQGLNVSERCMQDTEAFLWEMNQDRPQQYAVLMYDAFGKIRSDVDAGNVNRPGSRTECQSVRGPSFFGQYCQVLLMQDTVRYFVGLCVPDSCGEEEVQILVVHDQFQLGQTSLLPPLPPILVPDSTQAVVMTKCFSNTKTPDSSTITCLMVCCVMVAIPLAATLFTAIKRWKHNREVGPRAESSSLNTSTNLYGTLTPNGSTSRGNESHTVQQQSEMGQSYSEEDSSGTRNTPLCFLRSCTSQCLQAFSLQTTSRGVLSTSSATSEGSYSSLHGIRALSLLWIICRHTIHLISQLHLDNYKTWEETATSNFLYVFTSSGPVYLAVDTFLLLGGLLSAKSLLSCIRRAEDKMSPRLVACFLFKRVKRLQPMHLFILCLAMSVFSMVEKGAYGQILENAVEACKMYWWSNVLLINNFITLNDSCIPWTWYLSVDFQYYISTPVLICLYRWNRGVFTAVAVILLLVPIVSSAVITALYQIPVTLPKTIRNSKYNDYYYHYPHTRYGPFLIGILMGIYMTTKKDQLVKHQWQAALGWITCLSGMFLLFVLAYILQQIPHEGSVPHALYQGLHRPLWALGVAWIILVCEEGRGGFIKTLLSLGLWVPLSNISFACYLVHPIFMLLYDGLQDTPVHYNDFNFMYLFSGHLVPTLVVGYVLTLLVEKPYILLKGSSG